MTDTSKEVPVMTAPELDLNLSAWIERRSKSVGPYADYIVRSVKRYEAQIARIERLEEDNQRMREAVDRDLSVRMEAAGMVPLDAMTKPNCLTSFAVHSGMTDLDFFGEWVERNARDYGRMQAAHQAGARPLDDDMFNYVMGKSGAFKEVLENYHAAIAKIDP